MDEQRREKVAPDIKASDEPIRPDATKNQLKENERGVCLGILLRKCSWIRYVWRGKRARFLWKVSGSGLFGIHSELRSPQIDRHVGDVRHSLPAMKTRTLHRGLAKASSLLKPRNFRKRNLFQVVVIFYIISYYFRTAAKFPSCSFNSILISINHNSTFYDINHSWLKIKPKCRHMMFDSFPAKTTCLIFLPLRG